MDFNGIKPCFFGVLSALGVFTNDPREGWGLLQVLEGMHEKSNSQQTLAEFVRSARKVLNHRVFNSPHKRHEERWLAGWLRRVNTYLITDKKTGANDQQ